MLERLLENLWGCCFYNFSPIVNAVKGSFASSLGSRQVTWDRVETVNLREVHSPATTEVLGFGQEDSRVRPQMSSSIFTICVSGSDSLNSHCIQSSPNNSTGCCVRIVPLPQRRSSAEQYFWHPQQIRSGCLGLSGDLAFIPSTSCYTLHFPSQEGHDLCHSRLMRANTAR